MGDQQMLLKGPPAPRKGQGVPGRCNTSAESKGATLGTLRGQPEGTDSTQWEAERPL